jgi:hypothetical protein
MADRRGVGLLDAYRQYVGDPFASMVGGAARGYFGLEKPTYANEEAYRTAQAFGNMPGVGAPAGVIKAAMNTPDALIALGGLLAPRVGRLMDRAKDASDLPAGPYIQTSSTTTGKLLPRSDGMYTPGVPQEQLPRAQPRGGVYNERTEGLLNSRSAKLQASKLIDKGRDMKEWYGTEPLRQAAMDAGLSQDEWQRMMGHLASASQRNPVDQQNKMGSFLWYADQQGLLKDDPLLLTKKLAKSGVPDGARTVELPPGYGSLAQSAIFDRAKTIAAGGIDEALPPDAKLGTFYRNLLGNHVPVTVDVNALRGPVIASKDPRWLTTKLVEKDELGNVLAAHTPRADFQSGKLSMDAALARPGFWEAAPQGAEYGGVERFWQEAAKRNGVLPDEAQAMGWYGSGDITALKTKPELYVDNFERMVRQRASQLGERPMKVLMDVLQGKNFLSTAGTIGAAGLLAAQPGQEDQPIR